MPDGDYVIRMRSSSSLGSAKMRWRYHRGRRVLLQLVVATLAMWRVSSMKVSCSAKLKAIQGNALTLDCSFSSASHVSSLTSVEWSYRPPSGQPMESVFHFLSKSYLPTEGRFKGRIKWTGDIVGGDASIQLLNASLNDNGTFTCAVRNPPQDAHGSPCQIELTITPKELSLRFSYVAVLMALILLPSAVITLVLLGRICCCQRDTTSLQGYHSPIEVIEGEEHDHMMHKVKHRKVFCCEMYLQDFDESYYNSSEELQKEAVAESRC